jgi:hypothetical protein
MGDLGPVLAQHVSFKMSQEAAEVPPPQAEPQAEAAPDVTQAPAEEPTAAAAEEEPKVDGQGQDQDQQPQQEEPQPEEQQAAEAPPADADKVVQEAIAAAQAQAAALAAKFSENGAKRGLEGAEDGPDAKRINLDNVGVGSLQPMEWLGF